MALFEEVELEGTKPLPSTKAELCTAYNISSATLYRWLRPFREKLAALGVRHTARLFTPMQVQWIFDEALGRPDGW